MAFGKITVQTGKKAPARPVRERKARPAAPEKGLSTVEFLLIAPTGEEAEDYLCGLYFDLVQATGGSRVTAYTREFPTITRLSENKQSLEEMISKPVGREFVRQAGEDGTPLEKCTLTIGEAGNTGLGLDLSVTVTTPERSGEYGADVVFALLSCAEGPEKAAALIRAARSAAGGKPLVWILSNFEDRSLIWTEQEQAPPAAKLRGSLREQVGVTCGSWEFAAYVQLYGGLEFVRREQGKAVLRTNDRCREYMPALCHIPALAALEALRRYRASKSEDAAPDAGLEKIWLLMKDVYVSTHGWYDGSGIGGSGL